MYIETMLLLLVFARLRWGLDPPRPLRAKEIPTWNEHTIPHRFRLCIVDALQTLSLEKYGRF